MAAEATPLSADGVFAPHKMSVLSVPFTAFARADDADAAEPMPVNLTAVEGQARFELDKGSDVVLLGGTTAEWPSLSTQERLDLAVEWRKHIAVPAEPAAHDADGDDTTGTHPHPKLILHIGANSIGDARLLAASAKALAYDAVLVSAPCVFVSPTLELLVESVAQVLARCPDTPALYYKYGPLYKDNYDIGELMEALCRRCPSIIGLKVSGGVPVSELREVCDQSEAAVARFGRRLAVILTGAGNTLPGLELGARAIVAYPWESPMFKHLLGVASDSEGGGASATTVAEAQAVIDQQRAAIGKHNVPTEVGNYQITGAKGLANALGLNVGPCRLPLPSLPEDKEPELRAEVEKFF